MNGEHQLLVTEEPVEFEKYMVEVQDFGRIVDPLRGIHRIHLKIHEEKTVSGWTLKH